MAKRGRARTLTHVDAAHRPTMVDVGAKEVTLRVATAEAVVAPIGARVLNIEAVVLHCITRCERPPVLTCGGPPPMMD